jgi:CrcB protein
MNSWTWVLVGAGGAAGAVLRYTVGRWFLRWGAHPTRATLTVNLAGSLAIGFLAGLEFRMGHPVLNSLLAAGFLGGLTTFSTLNVQKALLAGEGDKKALASYIFAAYAGGWILTAAGIAAGHAVWLST